MTTIFRYNILKAIQASAVLLKSEAVNRMASLRLLKLLYIADRESLKERACPITGDHPIAMDNGPILGTTCNVLSGRDFLSPEWGVYIGRAGHRDLTLVAEPGVGHLTRWEIAKLDEVAQRFEDANDWEVAEYTQTFEEWKKNAPAPGERKPIPLDDLLAATGLSDIKQRLIAEADVLAVADREIGNRRQPAAGPRLEPRRRKIIKLKP